MNSSGSSDFAVNLPPYVTKVHDEASGLNLAHFNSFHSKASGSLGASQPAAGTVEMALHRKGGIQCVSVPDELSMQSAVAFASTSPSTSSVSSNTKQLISDEHKVLVELACSTTLSMAFKPQLLDTMVPPRLDRRKRNVVFIVCGGFKIDLKAMAEYEKEIQAEIERNPAGHWNVVYNDGLVVNVDYTV